MNYNFEDIYKKYYSSLNKYLFSLTQNEDLAEELTQETFFKALKNINKYDEKYKMLTWLCQIGKNTYYSLYKKSKRNEVLDDSILSEENVIIDKIIDSETNKELLKIVHSLDEPFKEVFTLRTYGELSFKDISDIFGKTESWARVVFYRAKLKIKEELINEWRLWNN